MLATVGLDRVDPVDLPKAEREIAAKLFGDVDKVPEQARAVLAIMAGARGGKSYAFGGLFLLWSALSADLSTLAPGEQASTLVVAPDLRLGRQVIRYARGAAGSVPTIDAMVDQEGRDGFEIVRPDGHRVRVEALPATRGGSAIRGRTLAGAVLDEACFLRDSDSVVNDEDLFAAVAPRVVPGGHVVIASTPWAEAGLLWDLFSKQHGDPQTALVAHAPTLLLRDDDITRAHVERERRRDPDNAAREFDAIPMTGSASQWFDATAIAQCTITRPRILTSTGDHRLVSVGVDLGFRSDASALVVLHREADGTIRVAETIEIRPQCGAPLVPSAVVTAFAEVALRHGATTLACDYVYLESLREHAATHGLEVMPLPAGTAAKTQRHIHVRHLFAESKVDISAEDRALLRQLGEVTATATPGGNLAITQPRRAGSHGDLASAFIAACWYAEAQRLHFDDDDGAGCRVLLFGHDGCVDLTADGSRDQRTIEPAHDGEGDHLEDAAEYFARIDAERGEGVTRG